MRYPSPTQTNTEVSLDGDWAFAYSPNLEWADEPQSAPRLARLEQFVSSMPVPGYWDDNLDRLKTTLSWSLARFNPKYRKIEYPTGTQPPDASLPNLIGIGYYRKTVNVPEHWQDKSVVLRVGGARINCWIWVNARLVAFNRNYSVPFDVDLTEHITCGADNDIVIAVTNDHERRGLCSLRGYHGLSAGIYRPVTLMIGGRPRIVDFYVHPGDSGQSLTWRAEVSDQQQGLRLDWAVRDTRTDMCLGSGSFDLDGRDASWSTPTCGMRPWSDHEPKLYRIELALIRNGTPLDVTARSFGLRTIERAGVGLQLNGRPIMLRGGCDHCYFPVTCTPPPDTVAYKENIRRLKKIGFNWIRFHTWVPPEEYMQAADELGMMLQVEMPSCLDYMDDLAEREWVELVRSCRKHPSVVLYCFGNESPINDISIEYLSRMAALQKLHAPDALFNPMEALNGVDSTISDPPEKMLGEGWVGEPYYHNPVRLAAVRDFSDVLSPYCWSMLSYDNINGDWRVLDDYLSNHGRPVLAHESGIIDNFIDIELEHRYDGTRIGQDSIYPAARDHLASEGVLNRARKYYENSSALAWIMRKHTLETARRCKYIAGYDYLGAFDQHWHRSGYPAGFMNEFYELKWGESVHGVLRFNGESVVLLDCTRERNLIAGREYEFGVMSSLYGAGPLEKGELTWCVKDSKGVIRQRGMTLLRDVRNGCIENLGIISFTAPDTGSPTGFTVHCRLSGGEYEIRNDWDFWSFPIVSPTAVHAGSDVRTLSKLGTRYPGLTQLDEYNGDLRIVSMLDSDAVDFLESGGKLLLLGSKGLPAAETSFQPSITGRVDGSCGTIIVDHPLMDLFPHSGFCDWQFFAMLHKATAVEFAGVDLPFDPIIEIISSYKLIRKQSCLFEFRVGDGRLLVCSLSLDLSNPAAVRLLDGMIDYISGSRFLPRAEARPVVLRDLTRTEHVVRRRGRTDITDDPNART